MSNPVFSTVQRKVPVGKTGREREAVLPTSLTHGLVTPERLGEDADVEEYDHSHEGQGETLLEDGLD